MAQAVFKQFYDLDSIEYAEEDQAYAFGPTAAEEALGLRSDKLYLASGGPAGMSQEELELMFSKHQLKPRLAEGFIQEGFGDELEAAEIPVDAGIAFLVELALHRTAGIETMAGVLLHHFLEEPGSSVDAAETIEEAISEAAQMVAFMAAQMVNHGYAQYDPARALFIAELLPTKELQDMLDLYQYPLPMIEEPRPVSHNKETGYRTIKRSIILKDNHTEEDVCLDHINRVNRVPLALNSDVVAFVENKWRSLDKAKPDETAEKYQKRLRAFAKYTRVSLDVVDALMAQGNRFWLTHRYDKRGRTYCQGYHATYQGNDWNKACIQFADAELVNEE